MNFKGVTEKFLKKGTFFKGSAILAFTTVLSYALGLLRDRTFALTFGATSALDAYNAAFTLPDLILNILVAGALTAAFVPIFSDLSNKNAHDEAKEFVNSVINGALIMILVCAIAVFIFAPQLSKLIVPGFDDAAKRTFVNLTRLLLLSPIIFSISNTFGNILVSREKFFWYGISAPLYNLGIILGTLFLTPKYGIYGVAIGVIAGSLLHLISRLIGTAYRFPYRPKIKFNRNYREFIRIMIPKIFGHPIEQFTFLGFTIIASLISTGSIAILNFARNFQSMPINVIGVTIALTAFPILARAVSNKDRSGFNHELNFTIKLILLTALPAALLFYLIRYPLINIFLGGSAFNIQSVKLTADTLGLFALSIPTESMIHVLSRAFYALKNSLTPVLISVVSLIVYVGFGYIFSIHMGVRGLALGFFIGSASETLVLLILLRKETLKLHSVS